MAWRFRKSIKIIPGVKLNFSKSGISTSIGLRGANFTFSKSGTYLNTSIPGLGLYNRQKLSSSNDNSIPQDYNFHPTEFKTGDEENIFSADLQQITSQDMQGIKEAILAAHQQRKELQSDLLKVKITQNSYRLKLVLSYIFLFGLIKKSISENIKADINSQTSTIHQIQDQIEKSHVELDIEFDPEISQKYLRLVEAFKKLSTSAKIWDVTSAHQQDRVTTRSSAGTLVNKKEVKFGLNSIADIKSKYEALWLNNANGADLYIYPNFIIMHSSKNSFAIIGLNEIEFTQTSVRFTETGSIPADSKVIDRTWLKVNKNGAPDKRFKGNYQIPVVRYGEISLKTITGLNEEYEFSNYEYTEEFGKAFRDYQSTIKSLKQVVDKTNFKDSATKENEKNTITLNTNNNMGLFDKIFNSDTNNKPNPEQYLYSPKSEQEAWIAIMYACMISDGEVSDAEVSQLSRTVVFKSLFKDHNTIDYYKTAMTAHIKLDSKQLIDLCVSKVSDNNKATLFAITLELVMFDGTLSDSDKDIIEHLATALQLQDELASKIIEVTLIRNKYNVLV
ncbi:hypothetical protein AHMF7605_12035 [Adhaeribacter arboris]|uniref:DUF4236 domain-containing protein n=1 Tax=Adhaeribacter arboris TaxID=2072846 RepID=A0A2T2YFB3_9BACT|nr:DUF4236 domain-containing protein [Adhaeribacter arboris]PSR54200.1 hypothetical protein AHMF7605_12035 [Adhaeribacter arboris]